MNEISIVIETLAKLSFTRALLFDICLSKGAVKFKFQFQFQFHILNSLHTIYEITKQTNN